MTEAVIIDARDLLTPRQRQVLLAITDYIRRHGEYPTYRALAALLGIGHPNGIVCHLRTLERKGWLEPATGPACARKVRLRGVRLALAFDDTPQGRLARALLDGTDPGVAALTGPGEAPRC